MAGGFQLQLREFAAKTGAKADLVVRKVTLDLLGKVVKRSPVDTGRFRGNWCTQVGSRYTGTTLNTDKSGGKAIADGASKLLSFQCGPDIWITNNLPYAVRLENGWSKQAPAGMVGITVTEFQSFVRKAVESLK